MSEEKLTDDFVSSEVEIYEKQYAANSSLDDSTISHNAGDLILLVHGIRTPGDWMKLFIDEGYHLGTIVIKQIGFKRVSSPEFLIRPSFIDVENFVYDQIIYWINKFPNTRVSIICHSFGSKILSSIIDRVSAHKGLHVIVFMGGVCKQIDGLSIATKCELFVNDCGNSDIWPIVAHTLNPFRYNHTGHYGFRCGFAFDRFYNYDHYGYLTKDHFNEEIVPIFTEGKVPDDPEFKSRYPYWLANYATRLIVLSPVITIVILIFL